MLREKHGTQTWAAATWLGGAPGVMCWAGLPCQEQREALEDPTRVVQGWGGGPVLSGLFTGPGPQTVATTPSDPGRPMPPPCAESAIGSKPWLAAGWPEGTAPTANSECQEDWSPGKLGAPTLPLCPTCLLEQLPDSVETQGSPPRDGLCCVWQARGRGLAGAAIFSQSG